MRFLLTLAFGSLLFANSALAADSGEGRRCGFRMAPCKYGMACSAIDPECPATRGQNCAGRCTYLTPTGEPPKFTPTPTATEIPVPTPTYPPCGGDRREGPLECEEGLYCIDDPRKEGCGMACDDTGICVERIPCGGYFQLLCDEGLLCIEDPFDGCDPENGGADCNGMCV